MTVKRVPNGKTEKDVIYTELSVDIMSYSRPRNERGTQLPSRLSHHKSHKIFTNNVCLKVKSRQRDITDADYRL